jgi:uncharacterized protein YndB with AHSA1/START domain
MTESATVHNTFVIERNYPQPPASVYAAFAEPNRKRRWYAEGDHEIQEFEMDFRTGGAERFRYTFKPGHPLAGQEIITRNTFEDIVPQQRILVASAMRLNGKTIQVALITFEFIPAGAGTDLICTNQGAFFDWPGGPAMLESGWKVLIDRLGQEIASH